MEDDNIELDNIIFHNEVGSGAYGTVHRVTFRKPYKGYSEAAAKNTRVLQKGEVEIMKKLRHKNIVTFICFYSNGPLNIIVLEFASGGSLLEYLRDMSKEISVDEKDKWANQAALAIQYLHRNQYLHRDIKPENCLLFENNTLKLCDFGLAREIDCSTTLSSFKGTCKYMAPEIIRTDEDNKSTFSIYSDIYAYGMLLLAIYTRKTPFEGMAVAYVIYNVGKGKLKPTIPSYVPADKAKLMKKCWEVQSKNRPTIERIVEVFYSYMNIHSSILIHARRVAVHTNGDIVIGGTNDKLLYLCKDGKKKMELQVENQPNISDQIKKEVFITDIQISPQGHVCVRKLYQSNILMFSESGALLNQLLIPNCENAGTRDFIAGFTFDRDGRLLIANGNQGVITAHEYPSGEIVGNIKFKCEKGMVRIGITVNKKNQILYHFSTKLSLHSKVGAIDHSGNELFAFNPKKGKVPYNLPWVSTVTVSTGIVCDSHDNIIVAMGCLCSLPCTHEGHIHKYSPTGSFLECIPQGRSMQPINISMSHDASFLHVLLSKEGDQIAGVRIIPIE